MAEALGKDLPTSPEGLLAVLREAQLNCLKTIETLASQKFRHWQARFDERERYLAAADTELVECLQEALNGSSRAFTWVRGFSATYSEEALIGSALKCFVIHNNGIAPSEPTSKHPAFLRWLYQKVALRTAFDELLYPTRAAVAAAMLLTACETGANPAVLCELSTDLGIKPHPDQPGAFLFESLKRRAGNKFIVSLLRAQRDDGVLPAIDALNVLSTALAPLRAALGTDAFFVFRFYSAPSYATNAFLAYQLKYLLRDADLDSKYKFTPSAIRTCVLVLHSLSKAPDSQIERQLAGHAEDSTATSRYEFRLEQRLRLSAYARRYQMEMLQLGHAIAAGSDQQPVPLVSQDVGLLQSQFVDITDDLILDAVLTARCLERANDDLVRYRRAHWLNVCEPELAWSTVLLEKAKRSPLAHRVPWAERVAEKLLQDGFFHHLE